MPERPFRPCAHPGCRTLTRGGRCPAHAGIPALEFDARRGSSTERGYDARWRAAREAFLRERSLCECDECKGGDLRVLPATVVDHVVPHRGDQALFWDESNWRPMAKQCHDRKTAGEVNARKREERGQLASMP